MGRPEKPVPAHVEPEDASQEVLDEEPASVTEPEEESDGASISKAAAVRDALAKGNDSPEAGIGYLHSVYGIVMTRQMLSSYKAQEKARQAKKGGKPATRVAEPAKRGPKPKAAFAAPARPPVAQKSAPNGQTDLLDALAAMKPLIAKYGALRVDLRHRRRRMAQDSPRDIQSEFLAELGGRAVPELVGMPLGTPARLHP